MRYLGLLCCVLITTLPGCNVDRFYTLTFDIENDHTKEIRLEFKGYQASHGSVDTTFTIAPGKTEFVFFAQALGPRKDTYVQSNKLIFCDSIKLSSDGVVSKRDLTSGDEWEYHMLGRSNEQFLAKIASTDF